MLNLELKNKIIKELSRKNLSDIQIATIIKEIKETLKTIPRCYNFRYEVINTCKEWNDSCSKSCKCTFEECFEVSKNMFFHFSFNYEDKIREVVL